MFFCKNIWKLFGYVKRLYIDWAKENTDNARKLQGVRETEIQNLKTNIIKDGFETTEEQINNIFNILH